MKITLIIVVIVCIVWNIWGLFSSRVEQAEYTIIEKANGYEIRNYPAHIVAQTVVEGQYDEALNTGFRIIANYIFGGNTKKQSIAMTAPVVEQKNSESIAMTSPVLATNAGEKRIIAFGMPRSYTLDTLPIPNDTRIQLVEIPQKKMAVLTFSWSRTTSRIIKMQKELDNYLLRDKKEIVGEPAYAGYNGPATPPWMQRHEVMIEIR